MAVKAIHINLDISDPHNIKAEDDAAWLGAITGGSTGPVSGILPWGDRLRATKVSDTKVRLSSGLYSMQGFVIKVIDNEEFTIKPGSQGMQRIDVIVAEYKKGSPRDSYTLKVIQGTQASSSPTTPNLTSQNLHFGGSLRQEIIARITINGTTLQQVTTVAPVVKGLSEMITLVDSIRSDVSSAKRSASSALPLSGGTMSGDINMSNRKIKNVGTPTSSGDVVIKSYADDKFNAINAKLDPQAIIRAIAPYDGANSGLDADKLDGIEGTWYVRKDQDSQYIGTNPIVKGSSRYGGNLRISNSSGTEVGSVGFENSTDLVIENKSTGITKFANKTKQFMFNGKWAAKVDWGTSVPSTLELGEIYIQI